MNSNSPQTIIYNMRTTTFKTKIAAVAMLLTGLTLSSSLLAQDISGTWHGKLSFLPAR